MTNLSELLPAGAGAKSADFVASGTLVSGVTVALKADGTVGVIASEGIPPSAGTSVAYVSGRSIANSATFDSNSNKVVVAFRNIGNSNYGTAVVGTVSGTSISFGTPVVFNAASTPYIATTFDSSNNKVVIFYKNEGNSNYGTAIIGTVSGTSISFGSPVIYESATTQWQQATFDSNSNKVVIAWQQVGDSYKGYAAIGTVSGTSISFTSYENFSGANSNIYGIVFDSSNNKVVITYVDNNNSASGTAVVGTVSGSAITFGTPVAYSAGTDYISLAFDSSANQVVISYRLTSNGYGYAIAGTVSGTSISFGTPVVFSATSVSYTSTSFDSNTGNIVIAYRDGGNLNYGTSIVGTVSGTSISFGTPVVFENARADYIASTFDSSNNKVVIAYENYGNSQYGTGVVFQTATSNNVDFIGITDQAIADTATGAVIVQGGVSDKLSGLTVGADYYVQDDGSISSPTAPYPYNLSGGVYDSVSLAVSDNLTSIFFKPDGTKMYAIGYTNDILYEYGLSSAFDLSSATLNGNTKNISAQSGYTPSIVFKSDGTKMYALGGGSVFQYSLSTAWDVSSASYDSKSLSVSSQDSNSSGIWFKSDGTEIYMCGFTNDSIFQYNLSTPWDVSSGSYASISFDMSATSTQPRNMYFDSTGTILFLADTANPDKVFKFVLSTAWDITTISFSSSLDVSAQAAKAVDVVLNADGTKMYVADSENTNTIYQYTLKGSTSTVPAGRALSSTSILLEG